MEETNTPSSSTQKDLPSADATLEDRLNWRSHSPIISPSLERENPFEQNFGHAGHPVRLDQRDTENNDRHEGQLSGSGIPADSDEREDLKEQEDVSRAKTKLSWRERVRHFTWTWFTMTMATGGLANVMYTVPHPLRFPGLYALGCTFFILNIVLFIFNVCMISWRFYEYPKTFAASFKHPTESLFIPAAVISFGTILINVSQYGVGKAGGWLDEGMWVLYWVYCGLAVWFSCGVYLIMWSTQTFTISQMTPIWIFPAYPLLIVGPHAGQLAGKLSPDRAINVIVSGWIIQGVGFLVSLMIYSAFLYRLMTQKLPKESLRPGMFISVGPSGFTIAGIMNMGKALPKVVPPDFMGEGNGVFAARVSEVVANWIGLWLWGLALWFFFVSVGAHWSCATRGKMDFAMTWYSFVFPNTALTTATFAVAGALGGNRPIQYIGCVMTVALVVTWIFVFIMMIRAVWLKQILWPQKQEDRSEGGWKQPAIEEDRRSLWVVPSSALRGDEEAVMNRGWSFRRTWTARERATNARLSRRNTFAADRGAQGLRRWSFARSLSRRGDGRV